MSTDPAFALPAGTVTLLLADIEGSTRAWERDPAEMTKAITRLNELVDTLVGDHGGVRPVEQGEGDSFVAAFSRATDAVACAVELQIALTEDRSPIAVRVGVHTGEVRQRDSGNYAGSEVNRCARLRDIGHGGQVLLSRASHDLVVDHLPEAVTARDLGAHRLRDLARPEHVFQLCHPQLRADFPPLRSLDAMPNNLPVQLTTFIGRRSEIGHVRSLLADRRLLTLTGPGGCGKTRLALQAAAEMLDEYNDDGVWLVELASLVDGELVVQAVVEALSYREGETRSLADALVTRLAPKRALLVLDNCEHVVTAVAELVEALLRGCPQLTVLATSRQPLGVASEVTWQVPSLTAPVNAWPARIDTVRQYEAVQLFIDRAMRARPTFAVTNENAAAVAEICQRLDGIPLAIELAAARTRVLAPQQICDGLVQRFELLAGGARTSVPRQQTLRASMDWSYDLLSEEERVLLRQLSVFAGTFSLEAADAVFGAPVLQWLTQLVDRSLVLMDDVGANAARFRLLETVRQYAAERIDQTEAAGVRDRHRDFYIQLVEEAEPHLVGPEQRAWLLALDADQDNVRAAYGWAKHTADAHSMLRLAVGRWRYGSARGFVGEVREHLEEAVAAAGSEFAELRGRALVGLAFASEYGGRFHEINAHAQAALDLATASGDAATRAYALERLGYQVSYADLDRGLAMIEEAIAWARPSGDDWLLSIALTEKAQMISMRGRDLAFAVYDEAIQVAHASGNTWIASMAEALCAWALSLAGEIERASALAGTAVCHASAIGDRAGEGWMIGMFAMIQVLSGDTEAARESAQRSAALAAETGAFMTRMYAVQSSATVAAYEGDAAAVPLQRELFELAKVFPTWVWLLPPLAEAELDQGMTDTARQHIEETFAGMAGDDWGFFRALPLLARGRLDGDEDALHEALRLAVDHGVWAFAGMALERLASIAARQESPAEATRLLAAVAARSAQSGSMPSVTQRRMNEETTAAARAALGDEAFDAAWCEGAALSLEEAAAYAARGRGERKRPSVGWNALTPTEHEVVKLVVEGLTNPQIAERLFMARNTVRTHLQHVFAKLSVSTRAELAAVAARRVN